MAFKLPRLQSRLPIVDAKGNPVTSFQRFFNIDFVGAIEKQETSQAAVLASLQNIQTQQAAQLAQINQALELAGLALATADSGSTTQSGSNTGGFGLFSTSFAPAVTVSLTSVVAGTLTIPGTAPQLIYNGSTMSGGLTVDAEFRLVEVVGGIDNVRYTGSFTITDVTGDEPFQVFQMDNFSAPDVAALSQARTSTGSVDYRIDVRRVSGATMTNLRFYLFARRAP